MATDHEYRRSPPAYEQLTALTWGGNNGYGALPPAAEAHLKDLRRHMARAWDDGSHPKEDLLALKRLLDRLDGFLLQIRRLIDESRALVGVFEELQVHPQMGKQLEELGEEMERPFIFVAGREIITDFESLLFHARAVLDQQTSYVTARHGQRNCHRFSKLPNVLANFAGKSAQASQLANLLTRSEGLEGVVLNLEERWSLRSTVTHRTTVPGAFTVHRVDADRRLVFDCDAFGFGVLATTHDLAREVPFIVLNTVGIYLNVSKELTREQCEPVWTNPSVRFDDWVDPTDTELMYRIVNETHPSGFSLRTARLHAQVEDHAVEINRLSSEAGA